MDHEKRESPRIELLGRMAGEVSVPAPTLVRNLSRNGAQIECAFPLILGSAHETPAAPGDEAVVVRARVVHSRIADISRDLVRYVAGLEFVELPPYAEAVIGAYLDRVQRERDPQPGGSG